MTGAGDFFSEDVAEHDAALRDHYWQVWGILLPIAVAIVASGISLFLLAGVLSRTRSGWPARITSVVRLVVIPLSVIASVPYFLGPEVSVPGWLEAVAGVSGMLAYLATAAMGVAIVRMPLPSWTGVSLVVGALLALVSFLPLFVFVGTMVGGIGMLRGSRVDAADRESQPATPPGTSPSSR